MPFQEANKKRKRKKNSAITPWPFIEVNKKDAVVRFPYEPHRQIGLPLWGLFFSFFFSSPFQISRFRKTPDRHLFRRIAARSITQFFTWFMMMVFKMKEMTVPCRWPRRINNTKRVKRWWAATCISTTLAYHRAVVTQCVGVKRFHDAFVLADSRSVPEEYIVGSTPKIFWFFPPGPVGAPYVYPCQLFRYRHTRHKETSSYIDKW